MMAIDTAPTPIRRPRAVLGGSRGIPDRIAIPVNDALAPCVEGQALCAEVAAHAERIRNAAMAGSRNAVWNEATRLTTRANRYRAEFARLAEDIEGPDDDNAA